MFKIKTIFIGLIFFVSGCSLYENARLLGISTANFQREGKVYRQDVDKSRERCYNYVVELFEKELHAKIYKTNRRKGIIIAIGFDKVFKYTSPSTEVAVFLQNKDVDRTTVVVSSLNSYLAEFVAKKVFGGLR